MHFDSPLSTRTLPAAGGPLNSRTRLWLPGWWVNAYQVSNEVVGSRASAGAVALRMGLSPAYAPVEMDALAVIFGTIQEQILREGSSSKILLKTSEHQRQAGQLARGKQWQFERVMQGLGGLRLLRSGPYDGSRSVEIFASEAWREDAGKEGLQVELRLAPLGLELLFGFAESYTDLARRVSKTPQAKDLLGDRPPLSIWRAPWLELQELERLLLLRIEIAMQWDFCWMQLDGIFGLALGKLFGELRVVGSRGLCGTPLSRQMRILAKLGRTLRDHGFLTAKVGDEFLAASNADEETPLLIWQASQDRLVDVDSKSYANAICQILQMEVCARERTSLNRVFGCNLYGDQLGEQLDKFWLELTSVSAAEGLTPSLFLSPNRPLACVPLFLEWMARQLQGHYFPLPEALADSQAARLASPENLDPIATRFAAFINFFEENQNFELALRDVPLGTLASPVSARIHDVAKFLNGRVPVDAFGTPRPVLVKDKTASPPKNDRGNTQQNANMKRVATEELIGLKSDPLRYSELKKAYLDSLDTAHKKLIADVQRTLTPDQFEKQIHDQLVRFMVANPGSWKSAQFGAKGL